MRGLGVGPHKERLLAAFSACLLMFLCMTWKITVGLHRELLKHRLKGARFSGAAGIVASQPAREELRRLAWRMCAPENSEEGLNDFPGAGSFVGRKQCRARRCPCYSVQG